VPGIILGSAVKKIKQKFLPSWNLHSSWMETNDVRKIHGLVIAREKMVTVVETPT
jgi:hypothetical protein